MEFLKHEGCSCTITQILDQAHEMGLVCLDRIYLHAKTPPAEYCARVLNKPWLIIKEDETSIVAGQGPALENVREANRTAFERVC